MQTDQLPAVSSTGLLAVPPRWTEALERAKMRYAGDRKDWERNFKDRMNFDEYKVRLELNAQVTLGYMAMDQAIEVLKKYRSANGALSNGGKAV